VVRTLVLLLTLLGSPAWAGERPAPLPAAPQGFAAGDSSAGEAYFVRLRAAEIGGNFDSAGAEEVHVFVAMGAEERLLAQRSLDLENTLQTYAFDDEAYVELRAGDPIVFDLDVRDADLTEWETIAGAQEPARLSPDAFGGEQGAPLRVALATIRGSSWSFFGTRTFKIEGASLLLELRRAPRRDALDDATRAAVAEALGAVAGPAPDDAADAARLEALLRRGAVAAMDTARRSTHTGMRRRLPPLAQEAYDLADVARQVAQAPTDPAPLRAALRELADALARCAGQAGPDEAATATALRETAAAARAIALPDRIGRETLDQLRAAQERLDRERERHAPHVARLRWETTPFAEEYEDLTDRLTALAARFAAARADHQARERFATGWSALAGRVRDATAR